MYAIDCNEISSVMQKIGFCERFDLKRQEIDVSDVETTRFISSMSKI